MLSNNSNRPADAAAVRAIADAAGFSIQVQEVAVEAGDLLVGDDFALVGADSCERLTQEEPSAPADGRARLRACEISLLAGDHEVIAVGSSPAVPQRRVRLHKRDERWWIEETFTGTGLRQPIFHLDMFILAGRGPDGRFRVLVADTRMTASAIPGSAVDSPAAILGDQLDEIANDLRGHDRFEVIRNPLPMIYCEEAGLLDWSIHSVEREVRWRRGWRRGPAGDAEALHPPRRRTALVSSPPRTTPSPSEGLEVEGPCLLPTYAHGRWKQFRVSRAPKCADLDRSRLSRCGTR